MTEYVFRRRHLEPDQTVEIPREAHDVDYDHRGDVTIVSWLEKKGESVR